MRLLAIAAALSPLVGVAQPYDPDFRWSTLETEHFEVHFHEGEEALAQRVARAAERAHGRLAPRLGHAPAERTQLVLSDDVDMANGMATPLPYNTMRLYAVPPPGRSELHDYRDWIQTLVDHEYVHVLHLDSVGGLPSTFNAIFGKLWIPNGLSPPWFVEGLAVLHEGAEDPGAGRNAAALFDMEARALLLEPPGFPSLQVATHPSLDWPVGDVPYLLGGKLLELIRRRHGDERIAAFVAAQGSRVWPWNPSGTARRTFGATFPELWRDLAQELSERYRAQAAEAARRPFPAPTLLTRRGGQMDNPRWSPDGSAIAWLERSLDERGGIRRAAPDGADLGLALPIDATGAFALRSPRQAIVSIGEVWREFRYVEDLWDVDLASGERRRLTDGERAADPDLRPGGDEVIYVARTAGGEMELRRRLLRGGPSELLLSRPGAQLYHPRISPDGRRIAFELHEQGRRDLALLEEGRVTRITDDDALDLDPAWSPDGRWLLFASDRGGIFNLYAREEGGAIRQVTSVATGAFAPEPSPDGATVAFLIYSREGYDVARLPLDPAAWLEPTPAPPAIPSADDVGAQAPLAVRPYSPWSTLAPRWWLPRIGADAAGNTWGASTGGADVLGRHAWALDAWVSAGSRSLGYTAAYRGGWSWPGVDAWSARTVSPSPGPPRREIEEWTWLAPGVTFTATRVGSAFSARAGWIATSYRSTGGDPGAAVPIPEPIRFRDGILSAATLQATWTNARRYVRSISSEGGSFALLDLQLADRSTGSDYDLARARGAIGGFLRVPGTRHGALAGRIAGGAARGSLGGLAPFRLGGLALEESGGALATAFPVGGTDALRGYPAASLAGDAFVLGNLEVRLPIARPGLGRTTWPVFLRRVSAAVFLDAGDAFRAGGDPWSGDHRLSRGSVLFGAGAEARLELFLGYYLPVELRLGVARGLGPLLEPGADRPASAPGPETVPYLTLAPAF